MTLSIMTLSKKPLSFMTLSIMLLSIMTRNNTYIHIGKKTSQKVLVSLNIYSSWKKISKRCLSPCGTKLDTFSVAPSVLNDNPKDVLSLFSTDLNL